MPRKPDPSRRPSPRSDPPGYGGRGGHGSAGPHAARAPLAPYDPYGPRELPPARPAGAGVLAGDRGGRGSAVALASRPADPPPPPSTALRPLLAAQAVGALGLAAGGTAGPLMAGSVLGGTALTPLPLGLLVLGSAGSAPAVTALMRARGRAVGLTVSYGVATLGALLVVLAGALDDGPALLAGSLLLGTGNNAVMLGRYVAADVVPPARTGRAVSAAMTAVTVGAVAGPALLGPAGEVAPWLGLPAPTGLYLLSAAAFPVAAVLTLRLQFRLGARGAGPAGTDPADRPAQGDRPAHGDGPGADPADRTTSGPRGAGGRGRRAHAARNGRYGMLLALAVLGAANLVMVTAMGVTPVHLHGHGWDLDTIGVLVAAHVAAMFGPSTLSGRLCDRIGPSLTAVWGSFVLLASLPLLAVSGGTAGQAGPWTAVAAMLLLGWGWNMQLISGSALVVQRVPTARRHRAEGLGESAMGTGAVIGTIGLAGPVVAAGGLPLLCGALGVVTVAATLPVLREVTR